MMWEDWIYDKMKEEWPPDMKLAAQFWFQIGKPTRFKNSFQAWRRVFRKLIEDHGEATLWGVLEFLRLKDSYTTENLGTKTDPCEFLSVLLTHPKTAAWRDRFESWASTRPDFTPPQPLPPWREKLRTIVMQTEADWQRSAAKWRAAAEKADKDCIPCRGRGWVIDRIEGSPTKVMCTCVKL